MHEILEFLANPYVFLVGSHSSTTTFNMVMVGVTLTLAVVAMLLPFPHGRGAMVPRGDREDEVPEATGQNGSNRADLTPVG